MIPALLGLLAARRRGAGGAVAKALTFRDAGVDAVNSMTHTVSSLSIGEGFPGRVIFAGVHMDGSTSGATINSVSIAGFSATSIVQIPDSFGNAGIFAAVVESGATASVVVNSSSTKARCGVVVWTASGLSSLTPHDTGTSTDSPSAVNLDTLEGGFALMVGGTNTNETLAFTGTGVTERVNGLSESPNGKYGGADAFTSGVMLAVGATWSGGGSNGNPFVAASF